MMDEELCAPSWGYRIATSVVGAVRIAISVATYRRTERVSAVLAALVDQLRSAGVDGYVLLVDNNPTPEARSAVEGFDPAIVHYVHEPRPGISAARNRALDECVECDAIVFIDDDELPCADWLLRLVESWQEWKPAAVSGPVVSTFESDPDPWVTASGVFDRTTARSGSMRRGAATNNLLVDLRWLRDSGLRFDERFGLTGGSDTMLTHSIVRRGGVIRWCDEAVVTETVPSARSTRRWVLSRTVRTSNDWSRVHLSLAEGRSARMTQRFDLTVRGLVRLGRGSTRSLVGAVTRSVAGRATGALDLASGYGMISGAWGQVRSEYTRPGRRSGVQQQPNGGEGQLRVTVGIPTFKRPEQVVTTVGYVLEQATSLNNDPCSTFRVDVQVVDNDPAGSARDAIAGIGSDLIGYVVESRPGISAARNRILDQCKDSDLLVFIDDDEHPHPGWLREIVDAYEIGRPAAVYGRVVAEFDGYLDPWIDAGEFFARFDAEDGAELRVAAAGNLLLDLHQVRELGLRFEDRLGLSGGEDTLFTRSITAAGRRIVRCAGSVVSHRIEAERMTRRWVLQRSWSHGNTQGLVEILLADGLFGKLLVRLRTAVVGAARAVLGPARWTVGVVLRSPAHQAKGLRTMFRGLGMTAAAVGYTYQEYAKRSTAPRRRSKGSPR